MLIAHHLVFLMTLIGQESDTHPFSIHDMLAMERISDLQVSSDGMKIAFVLRTTDMNANRGRTDIWTGNADGSDVKALTTHEASDFNPRFSSTEDRLYFLSSRSGSSQVWSMSLNGGEPHQVSDLALDINALNVSPDGKSLAIGIEVFPGNSIQESAQQLKAKSDSPQSGMLFDRLLVRHWDTWKDGRRNHVFVMPSEGGDPKDMMKDMDADCPTKPFGGSEDFTFTPNSKGVVFCARDAGREEAWSTDFDLYHSSLEDPAKIECLTDSNDAWDAAPSFSPDGKTLGYLAMERAGFEADRFRIILLDWESREKKSLNESWDRSPGSLVWTADSSKLLTTADQLGQHPLFRIDVQTGDVETLVKEGTVRGFAPAGDRIIIGMDHLRSPVELYAVSSDGSECRRITHINDDAINKASMGHAEQFTFAGWNNETVYAYVVTPADFDSLKKYPVAFLIHGGPQGSFGNDFHYRWNPQAYAGAGYAVVMVDFHGSVGYGQDFTDSIRNDWGGKPLVDLQKGLSAAIKKYSWMDGDNVVALGASYGGYMINWIAGNWPDRFRCLVNHDGNLDERLAYFDTEELWFPEWERGGTPWDNPEAYSKHNPIDHVKNWKTPMLVIHGALDYRVVDTQGISTFTALQRRGIPSQLLYFPDENHWIIKPQNGIQWHETVIGWINRWSKK